MLMQFVVGLNFEITDLECNGCGLILLSMTLKISYVHGLKRVYGGF